MQGQASSRLLRFAAWHSLSVNRTGVASACSRVFPSLTIRAAEAITITGLVFGTRAEPLLVAGIGRLELPLSFQVPPLISLPVLTARGTPFGDASIVPGAEARAPRRP